MSHNRFERVERPVVPPGPRQRDVAQRRRPETVTIVGIARHALAAEVFAAARPVAYAGAEVFHLGHAAVYAVAFYLLVSGALLLAHDFAELLGKEL